MTWVWTSAFWKGTLGLTADYYFEDYRYVVRRSGFVRVGTHVIQHEHRFDGESGRRAGANLAATLYGDFSYSFRPTGRSTRNKVLSLGEGNADIIRGVVQRGLLHHARGPAVGCY